MDGCCAGEDEEGGVAAESARTVSAIMHGEMRDDAQRYRCCGGGVVKRRQCSGKGGGFDVPVWSGLSVCPDNGTTNILGRGHPLHLPAPRLAGTSRDSRYPDIPALRHHRRLHRRCLRTA